MDKIQPNFKPNRIADDGIYLNENRYKKPKEAFKQLFELIKSHKKESFIDIGCATGELIYYLYSLLPDYLYKGIDISENLIERAKLNLPKFGFYQQDISKPYSEWKYKPKSDIVCMLGVLSVFDNYEDIFDNLISCTNKDGFIYVTMIYTAEPIDVIMRYRRAGSGIWESGWNTFSKESIQIFLESKSIIKDFRWHDFNTDLDLKKQDDPMRKWTINIDGKKELTVGSGQIIKKTLLEIKI